MNIDLCQSFVLLIIIAIVIIIFDWFTSFSYENTNNSFFLWIAASYLVQPRPNNTVKKRLFAVKLRSFTKHRNQPLRKFWRNHFHFRIIDVGWDQFELITFHLNSSFEQLGWYRAHPSKRDTIVKYSDNQYISKPYSTSTCIGFVPFVVIQNWQWRIFLIRWQKC